MSIKYPTLLATAALLMAVPVAAQMASQAPSSMQQSAATEPMLPSTYVMKARAGDLYEKESSRLLLTTTKNAKLRSFAEKMIADHTKSTNDVKAAAMKAGLHAKPPMLEPTGRANMAALRQVSGTARDMLYVEQQKASHDAALEVHQGFANSGMSRPLKSAAAKIAPVVQSHIDMLDEMLAT